MYFEQDRNTWVQKLPARRISLVAIGWFFFLLYVYFSTEKCGMEGEKKVTEQKKQIPPSLFFGGKQAGGQESQSKYQISPSVWASSGLRQPKSETLRKQQNSPSGTLTWPLSGWACPPSDFFLYLSLYYFWQSKEHRWNYNLLKKYVSSDGVYLLYFLYGPIKLRQNVAFIL